MYILTQAILAVKECPKLRRAQFDCELALPNRGGTYASISPAEELRRLKVHLDLSMSGRTP
jgi:hypothetical protein